MIVLLDNGHGVNTAGKRSPKGMLSEGVALYEYEFNRDIVCRMKPLLNNLEIEYKELVPELDDISLTERCNRANVIYAQRKDAFLISIHANAGGGTGWEVFTSKGETKSDFIASIFFAEAKKAFPEFRMRSDNTDGDDDKEESFTMLTRTDCPAILTENFFMDNEKDLAFILSDEGRQRIAEMHVKAIQVYGEISK